MTEHLSTSRISRFCVRALPIGELTVIAKHLGGCEICNRQFTKTLRGRRGSAPLSFTLAPEFWFRHEHLDFEQLVGFADKTLDTSDREIIDIHLRVCGSCKEDVRSFLEFREQTAAELETSYTPVVREPMRPFAWISWWRALAWKPIYAAAIVLIGIALIAGAAFFLKRRADFQARQPPTPQVSPSTILPTPTPDNRASKGPSPPATPNESQIEKPESSAAIVALNDRGGTITLDKNRIVSGLDDLPPSKRDEIARVLLSERLEPPTILENLRGEDATLRGSKALPPFKLTFPIRTVIVTDRPTLKWERVSTASSYRIYVNDQAGRVVARSDQLPSERTKWALPKQLNRGEVYAWTVVAVVEDKEIVSPGPSSSEMKFQVLSKNSFQQLSKIKKRRSHLALGVFCARVGLLTDAEREFQQLVRLNPGSRVAINLLHSVQILLRSQR